MPAKVSIVLPNHNYAGYLDERISSLLDQTFQDFELIIIDDASTDDSRKVISKYASDPKVRTAFFDSNSGHAYRRWNDGAALASGDYLLFAGADDSCAPTLLETLVDVLDANPNLGIAYVQSQVIDSAGRWGKCTPAGDRWSADFVATGSEEARFLLFRNTIPNASAALLRRAAFERCSGFDLSLRLSADRMLWARMLATSDLAFVAKPLNYYRKHGSSVTSAIKAEAQVLEAYAVVDFILQTYAIPADVRERSFDKMAHSWARRILSMRSLTAFSLNRRIYRRARRIDPAVAKRVVRAMGAVAKLRALEKTRSIRTTQARAD